jgi:hypothetical protein
MRQTPPCGECARVLAPLADLGRSCLGRGRPCRGPVDRALVGCHQSAHGEDPFRVRRQAAAMYACRRREAARAGLQAGTHNPAIGTRRSCGQPSQGDCITARLVDLDTHRTGTVLEGKRPPERCTKDEGRPGAAPGLRTADPHPETCTTLVVDAAVIGDGASQARGTGRQQDRRWALSSPMRNLEIDARDPAAQGSGASDRGIGDSGRSRRRGDDEQCHSATGESHSADCPPGGDSGPRGRPPTATRLFTPEHGSD